MKETTQENIGKIFTSAERDAIHIAVLPVTAHRNLKRGEHIGYSFGETTDENPIGIVDPFLKSVKAGEMFYIFLYPNTITSLRHMWTHPTIPDDIYSAQTKQKSEEWLRNFIENADCPGYDTVIAAALESDGDALCFYGDAHGDIPPEFWEYIEIVTGKKIAPENRATYFSCSC